jgi:hypothetical protein
VIGHHFSTEQDAWDFLKLCDAIDGIPAIATGRESRDPKPTAQHYREEARRIRLDAARFKGGDIADSFSTSRVNMTVSPKASTFTAQAG